MWLVAGRTARLVDRVRVGCLGGDWRRCKQPKPCDCECEGCGSPVVRRIKKHGQAWEHGSGSKKFPWPWAATDGFLFQTYLETYGGSVTCRKFHAGKRRMACERNVTRGSGCPQKSEAGPLFRPNLNELVMAARLIRPEQGLLAIPLATSGK